MSKNYYYSNDLDGIATDPFFDILFKNGLISGTTFQPFTGREKMPYPMNSYLTDEFLVFEVPIIKGKPDDVEITKTSDLLRIKYSRTNKEDEAGRKYAYRGIIQRDFDFQWRITSKFDSSEIQSVFEDGLLTVFIPIANEIMPEKVQIQNIHESSKKSATQTEIK